jgi:hypothetical protein
MRKLEELNVRITSADSLICLIDTLNRAPGVKNLSMRLDIPKDVQPRVIPSMNSFKGNFWLRLHKIDDDSSDWASQIIKALGKTPAEIHLQSSWLSPNVLQQFKVNVGTSDVFIAM